jgi:hypothetical protein
MQRTTINTGVPTLRFQKSSRSRQELLPPSAPGSRTLLIANLVVLCLCTCQAFPGPPQLLFTGYALAC